MTTQFMTARFPEGVVPRTSSRATMLARTRTFIRGQARIREAGGEFGPWKAEALILEQIRRRVDEMGVGPKLIVQRRSDSEQMSIREVETVPTGPDLGCAPELEQIHYAVWDEFPGCRSAGRFVCRYIDGTRTVSRHGYVAPTWHGAAEDVFPPGGQAGLAAVARFVITATQADWLQAATVIWLQRIWTPQGGERAYGGNWHGHNHIDVPAGVPCLP